MKQQAAVFLDRDGTLNEEVGYLDSLDNLHVFPVAYEAVRLINRSGMKAVVITNQSGVARGFFDEAFVGTVHARMQEMFRRRKARIDRFYHCPHHPTEGTGRYRVACPCRKPEPGLLLRASEEMSLDLAASYMVGDMPKDIEAARKVGAKGVLVKTGYGSERSSSPVRPDHVAADVLDAVQWIMKDRTR